MVAGGGLLGACLRWWAQNNGWAGAVGVLLALVAVSWLSRRGRSPAHGEAAPGDGASGSGTGRGAGLTQPARRGVGTQAAGARGVAAGRPRGVGVALVSCLGTVLEQRTVGELSADHSVAEGAPEALGKLAAAGATLYLVTQVADDETELGIRALLDSAGIAANAELLFCETAVGVSSMARQLEAQCVVSADAACVETLRRFIPRLAFVGADPARQKLPQALADARNVGLYASLEDACDAVAAGR